MRINRIIARQILDSRGCPTIEADVWLDNNVFGRAAVPSGASTGSHEAHELRDGGYDFGGQGVTKAIKNVYKIISPALIGLRADDQFLIDDIMRKLDGSQDKSNLGANAILAVSLATANAAARARGVLLYSHINEIAGKPKMNMPMPMVNVLNGGKHASQSTDIQESMIVPISAHSYKDAVQMCAEVFMALKKLLAKKGLTTAVGDEGGFTLPIDGDNQEALITLSQAVEKSGYKLGVDIAFALDVASSELYKDDKYHLKTEKRNLDKHQMIEWYKQLHSTYPIVSIEDGLFEDDWDGWQQLNKAINTQLVGDDFLVTNIDRLQKAIALEAANAILIKPNQIGTLTETLQAIDLAKQNNWNTIISHRSGETEDVAITHIAVGTGSGQIKTGSMSRTDRNAKHNELMRIEASDSSLFLINPFNN